jgi:zinc transporter ZupT
VTVSAAVGTRAERRPLAVLVPLAGLALLLVALVAFDPLRSLSTAPPTEALAVERVTLSEGEVEMRVRNDGAEPVTLAQVLVNDAYWQFTASRDRLDRFETSTVEVAYPWEEGLPLRLTMVTSTGLTFEHDIEAATLTPRVGTGSLGRYALIGLLVGVVPVAIGMLWLPALRRASSTVLRAVLAFTVGLLAVLLVDTIAGGLDLAAASPASLGGLQVFVAGALAALAAMAAVDHLVARRSGAAGGLTTAYLIAVGIGLHNAGEGIAIGAAVAAGELALGSSLLVGFAAHNSTEGLAIATPLASPVARESRIPASHLVALVAIAGLPTVLGAWTGGLAFSPLWGAALFGVAAGAIAQVVIVLGRSLVRDGGVTPAIAAAFVGGMAVMYLTGLLTA